MIVHDSASGFLGSQIAIRASEIPFVIANMDAMGNIHFTVPVDDMDTFYAWKIMDNELLRHSLYVFNVLPTVVPVVVSTIDQNFQQGTKLVYLVRENYA